MQRLAAALVVLAASLLAASDAQAGFAPTNDTIVTAPSPFASGLGTDGQGNSLVAWDQNGPAYEVKARRLEASGTLGPVLDLDPGLPGREPVVAMAASGRAFVAWRAPADGNPYATGVRGRWVEPDGSLGPVLTLAVGKEGELQAAGVQAVVDPAGVVTVTWKNEIGMGGGQLMLRRVQPDSTLGELVPDVTGGSPTEPKVRALPDGSTLVVWREAFIERIVVASNLAIGTPQPISGDNLGAEVELAVDSQGNALATWRRDDESSFGVRGRLLDPAGDPVGEELIFEPSLPGILDNRPVAADTLDDFLVTWWRPDADGVNVVYARPFNRLTGITEPTQTVSDPNLGAAIPLAAIDDFGTGAVVWGEFMGMTGSIPRGRTINSLGAPAGGIQELFSPRASVSRSSSAPAAGVAAFLMETPFSEGNRTVLVRRYLVPPRCADSTTTVVQGKPIDAPLTCAGPAIEGANVVEPPKHGTVGAFKPGPSLEYAPEPGFEGTDSFTYTALNDGGGSNVARVEIRVGKDTIKPTIERFRFVKSTVRKGRGAGFRPRKGKLPKRSYSFVLRISEPAQATVTVRRRVRGARRHLKVGKVSAKAALENLEIRVPGKLAKRLARGGRFRATALATDLAGNKSKPKTIGLRIQGKKTGR